MDIWVYIFLPAISALACLYLLRKLLSKKASIESMLLFSSLTLMNVWQVSLYLTWSDALTVGSYFADAYLITSYFFFTQLILFAISLSGKAVNIYPYYVLYLIPGTLSLFHIFGLMVASYRFEANALLHNDGILAWCFDLFILVACLATVSILWRNMRRYFADKIIASKNIIALVSFIPLTFVFTVLILLSRTPYAIPVVVIGPFITLYTAVTFYYLQRERVVDLSVGISFFINRLKLANQLLEMKNTKGELKSYTKAVERQFILEVMEIHDGNIQKTADYLGMNHTTLRNKIKEYEVDQMRDQDVVVNISA
ncbi:MAG: hypothetical protein L3J28_03430 [Candidatus Polarisedimenticolaceae bacterium]|nr:hypothetical protein [Candidatus Polarisedimenticolaceae bacterium]